MAVTGKPNSKRATLILLLTIMLAAAIVYGVTAAYLGPPAVVADGITYATSAARLLNTGVYSSYSLQINRPELPDAMQVPGYTLVLTAMYLFLPHSGDVISVIKGAIPAIISLNFVFAVVAAVIIAATGLRVGGRRMGWIAGSLAVAYLPFGAEAMSAWPENLRLLMVSSSLFCAVALLQSDGERARRWAAAYGLCGGATAMTMPAVAPWLAVPIALWLWLHRANKRSAALVALIGLVGLALALAPWTIRNAIQFRQFVPLSQHAGTVWIDSIGGRQLTRTEQAVYDVAAYGGEDGFKVVAFQRLSKKWRESPRKFIEWKISGAWSLVTVPWSSVLNPFTPLAADTPIVALDDFKDMSKPAYTRWTQVLLAIHRLLLLLAVGGLVSHWGRRETWLFVSAIVVCIVLNTVMLPWNRYFYPWMPSVILLASCFVTRLTERLIPQSEAIPSPQERAADTHRADGP